MKQKGIGQYSCCQKKPAVSDNHHLLPNRGWLLCYYFTDSLERDGKIHHQHELEQQNHLPECIPKSFLTTLLTVWYCNSCNLQCIVFCFFKVALMYSLLRYTPSVHVYVFMGNPTWVGLKNTRHKLGNNPTGLSQSFEVSC